MPPIEQAKLLDAVNTGLMVAGGVVLLVAVAYWIRRGGRDPLRGSPLRPNGLSAGWLWLAAMGYLLSGLIAAAIASVYHGPPAGEKSVELWRAILTSNLMEIIVGATMLAIAARMFTAGLVGFGLGRRPLRRDLRDALAGWLVSVCLCTLVVYVAERIIFWVAPHVKLPTHDVFSALNKASTPAFIRVVAVVGAVIFAPIGEECFFRGILQTGLHRIVRPKQGSLRHRWVAIGLTALVFGLMHTQTPQYVPALVLFGAILGFLYERTGSLLVPMLVHMLFNGKTLLWYYLGGAG